MKRSLKILVPFLSLLFTVFLSHAQTSWTGNINTNWSESGNWTAGVPNTSIDAILGDANFNGVNHPTVNTSGSCNSITIGGTVATTITLKNNLVVNGSFTINSGSSATQPVSTLTVKGNWVNNGSFTTTNNNSKIIFAGTTQTISGSSTTEFRQATINTGTVVTLGSNVTFTGNGSYVSVYGTIEPGQSPTYALTTTKTFRVFNGGKINVNASTFAGNYINTGTFTLDPGSIVNYSSTAVNQTVNATYSYSTLLISGTGIKSLSANLTALNSSSSVTGNIFVASATFDLGTFTANRGTSVAGGELAVSNGAILKVGGSSNFPVNYSLRSLDLASTVEYNGTTQTISAQTYGNLVLSSGSGAATKTMPGIAFTVDGNFTSMTGAGTSVSFTSASNITVNGIMTIGASTTFNGGTNTHTMAGNWVNNGTFTGNTGTISFDAPSINIGGSGTQNFNNINILRSGITATGNINVAGNFATSGSGQFTHNSSGLMTMTGASKTISGVDIDFFNLTVSGSVTTTSTFNINSNLAVSGTFTASTGTVNMPGTAKTISGAGTIGFSSLYLSGTITTASNFSVSGLLDVSGTFSASAGTVTFTGSSILSGTASLYNTTINGTSLLLSASSFLGIANLFTITAGTLNANTSTPNTVAFNGTGAQTVNAVSYYNLNLLNGNSKTAAGNITVNGNFTLNSSTTFVAGAFIHTVLRNWTNSGIFTASTSTIQFTGVNNSIINGATTFNILTLNKTAATNSLTLNNNISTATANMTNGTMFTGVNKITITSARAGNGIILGTITRTHAFGTGTAYAFEGPDNTINFSSAVGVTSVTVIVTTGSVSGFPNESSVNREYNIAVTATSYTATLRLHYEDAELNGNSESLMALWNDAIGWQLIGKSGNNSTSNYVEQNSLVNIGYKWTIAEIPGVVLWNGSVNTDWNTAGNWTNVSGGGSTPPAANDVVQIGAGSFTYHPNIASAVNVKALSFGSVQAATLTLATGGSLTTSGNIAGTWTADAVHTINTGNQNLTVNGNLILSNGISNRTINLNAGTGTVTVSGTLIQKGNAALVFSGAGLLNLSGDYNYTAGTFTAGSSTMTYNGINQQVVAPVSYNHLTINKTSGIATLGSNISIAGNLLITAGVLDINNATVGITGNVTVSSGATLDCDGVLFNVGGNWTRSGTYIFSSGTVTLNGTGTQNISAGAFNNLTINKSSGTATLTGNNTLTGNLILQSGILNLSTFTINRVTVGGTLSLSSGVSLQVGGANNFPANYSVRTLNANSTVLYIGTVAQTIVATTYGHLSFSNGGSNAKTQAAALTIAGDININSGATFHSGGFSATLLGNWTNSGTYTGSTGSVILNGLSKTITGNTSFNRVTVNGSYTVAGSNINYGGIFTVNSGASYEAGNGVANLSSDLINSGTLTSTGGTTNFTGTALQTIRLLNALISSSSGIVNFNGNVSPIMSSTSTPQFATLNINNTAGINPSVDWKIYVAMNISAGATFNGGLATHTVYGSFSNAGSVTSTGVVKFSPATPVVIALGSSGFTSDGVIEFGGTGLMTITGAPGALNTVIISNSNPSGVSASSNWLIDSNFVVKNNATFNAGSYTYTIGRNIESDGILNGGTSTFVITSAVAELSVSAETVFNNLTITGTLTPQTDFRVGANFINNGTYDGSIGTLIMFGPAAGSIGGTRTPSPIAQLNIQKTGGAVVTQNVVINNVSSFNILSGVYFTSTFGVTQDPLGGVLMISNNATLRIGGANSLPAFGSYGIQENSTVDYAGVATTQTVANAAAYGNLLISGTGNKTATVNIIVAGNLTITNGALHTATASPIHRIAGNFIMTGGVITGDNGLYMLNGDYDQTLNLLSNLVRLTVSKAGGNVILGSDVTVNLDLVFTAGKTGKIQTGNFKVIIPSTGTVTGPAQTAGWVIGNIQKNVATGTAVSRTFEVGGATYYTPATVLFASVSTAGNLTGSATSADHSELSWSMINDEKSVNRYWSFTNSGTIFTTAEATFNWVPSDLDAGTTTANFKVAGYDGTSWALTAMASPLPTSIKATGLTSFKAYGIGENISLYKWSGDALTNDWYTQKNWKGGVPTTTYNTLIPNGLIGGRVYPVISSGTGIVKDLTIESASALAVDNGTLQIAGAIANTGTFTTSNGTIEFNGSTAQVIPAGLFAGNSIKNLTISNNVSLAGTDTLIGTLTVAAGKTFTTNDNLVLRSNATGTARVGQLPVDGAGVATAFITGKLNIERFIPMRKAWRLLSAPVKSSTAPSINMAWQEGLTTSSANPNLYPGYGVFIQGGTVANGFDQGATSIASIKVYSNAANNFIALPASPGTNAAITSYPGYFLYIRGDRSINLLAGNAAAITPATLRIKGEVNTGHQVTTVNATKFTVLGNPFPSAIDFETLTKTNVKNSFYVWDPKLAGSSGLGAYVTFSWNSGTGSYDATTAASPLSKYIPSGEAIIIESADGINPGTVTIKESDKTTNGSDQVFGRIEGMGEQLRVNLYAVNADASTSLLDGILTTYNDDNSNAVNNDDAGKLNGGSENIGIKRDGIMLAIERRKTIITTDTTFINLYQMKIQSYDLDIIADNMDSPNRFAVIKDNYSNSINNMPLNLNGQTRIRFSINADPASYAINRFSIVFGEAVVMPVTIKTVKAYGQQKNIAVEWTTDNEVNIKQYEVERSGDGRNFNKVNTTVATSNNGGSAQYKVIDENPLNGNNYYRIRIVEQSGTTGYSIIVKVNLQTVKPTAAVVVYPNPVTGNNISLQMTNIEKGSYSMQLFNANGQLVSLKTILYDGISTTQSFEVNANFAAGKYELRLTGNQLKLNTTVIKR